jgi:hypothetical protein
LLPITVTEHVSSLNLGINYLLENEIYTDCYPLHQRDSLPKGHRSRGIIAFGNNKESLYTHSNENRSMGKESQNAIADEKVLDPASPSASVPSPSSDTQALLSLKPTSRITYKVNGNWVELGDSHTLRSRLLIKWAKLRFFETQPIDEVREYFGEKIAFYFLYLDYYNTWLIISAVLGVLVFIAGIGYAVS